MNKKNLVKKNSKKGQSSVEYILIIAVIVGVIIAFGNQFKSKINDVTENLFKGINRGVSSATGQQ